MRHHGSGPAGVIVLLAVLAAALSSCTGVPTSSSPQTIQPVNVGGGPATEQAMRPTRGEFPYQLVNDYLQANTIEPGQHSSAKTFLTTAARSRWSDATATILAERRVGTFDERTGTLTVYGKLYGTVDRDGVFTGGNGSRVSYVFKLAREKREYRIAQISPVPGLLLTSDEFEQNYDKHSLYFFDNANRYLVAEPRWTDIGGSADPSTDRSSLATWLLKRLIDGPRASLATAVSADTFPTQVDPNAASVDVQAITRIEVPGSSQLDPGARLRLAVQLGETLDDATSGNGMEITDGGKAVAIPSVSGGSFRASDFGKYLAPAAPDPEVFYLSGKEVLTESGQPINGPLGRGVYPLTSIALSRPDPIGPLVIAGVEGVGAAARLYVGPQTTGPKPVDVTGVTARPSLAGARHEVWAAAGTKLFRVTITAAGAVGRTESVPLTQSPGGVLRAVRVSPDGARIALVFATAAHNGQLFVGAIVRGSGPARIGPLDQINGPGTTIDDVGWLSPLKLYAIGHITGFPDGYTFDGNIDGTEWQSHLITSLASTPETVAVTPGATAAWLGAGGFVWKQDGSDWKPPTGGQTPGSAPVYLE